MSAAVLVATLHGAGTVAWAAFSMVRVLLWAILSFVAWEEIIEKDVVDPAPLKKPTIARPGASASAGGSGGSGLTAAALHQHDGNVRPLRRWPKNVEHVDEMSEMGSDESIDEWPIWHQEHDHQAAEATPPATPPRSAQTPGEDSSPAKSALAARVAQVQNELAEEVRGERAAMGSKEDADQVAREYKQMTSKTGHHKNKSKPWVTRKIERMFVTPYTSKLDGTGYALYRSLNKIGHRTETSVYVLAASLEESINGIGIEAVVRAEKLILRKYLKWILAEVLISVLLLPLPSVAINLSMG